MSKLPSAETQVRTLKRELKHEHELCGKEMRWRISLQDQLAIVTAERNEWRSRFDKLLERTPKIS